MDILLTNDDGYESPGIHSLADGLASLGTVTIVAPAEDQSAIGRAYDGDITITERNRGYEVTGTPVDAVVTGIECLDINPDIVISGCNTGANMGGHAIGRSGTISAAVEATFFSIPSIAVSLHIPQPLWPIDPEPGHFTNARKATAYLVEATCEHSLFSQGDYLNVNVPFSPVFPIKMRVTRPSTFYDMAVNRDGNRILIQDKTWDDFENGAINEAPDTDRGAVHEGVISVSPLSAPQESVASESLETIAERFQLIESAAE